MDCIFCKIASKEIDADIILEEDGIIAFNDLFPKAPTHILIIPTKHIATVNDLGDEDTALVGELVQTAKNLAKKVGIAEDGYRLVMNCNKGGGQEIFHLHLHLMGGRGMKWPPG